MITRCQPQNHTHTHTHTLVLWPSFHVLFNTIRPCPQTGWQERKKIGRKVPNSMRHNWCSFYDWMTFLSHRPELKTSNETHLSFKQTPEWRDVAPFYVYMYHSRIIHRQNQQTTAVVWARALRRAVGVGVWCGHTVCNCKKTEHAGQLRVVMLSCYLCNWTM